jgi:D-alanine-D-alanine ligase
VFVKPPHAGSSIGISKVDTPAGLESAITTALGFDTTCLVEEGVSPLKDLTCCVRQNAAGETEASLVQASNFGEDDFFTYQEKYLSDGGAQTGEATHKLQIPANLPENVTTTIQQTSKRIFNELGCSGIARVDWLYNPTTEALFANEINPLPGTLYHHLWKDSGVETDTLILDLLTNAVAQHKQQASTRIYFLSSILNNVEGVKLGKK